MISIPTRRERIKHLLILHKRKILANQLLATHIHIGARRKNEFFNPNISSQFLFESNNVICYNVYFMIIALRRTFGAIYARFYVRHPLILFLNQKRFDTYLAGLSEFKFIISNFWPGGMLTNYRTVFRRYIRLHHLENALGKHVKALSPDSRKSLLNIHTVIPRIPAALISFSANHLPINDTNSLGIFSLSFFNIHDVAVPPATIAVAGNITYPFTFLIFWLLTQTFYAARLSEKYYFLGEKAFPPQLRTARNNILRQTKE
jgi:hypothetical protein